VSPVAAAAGAAGPVLRTAGAGPVGSGGRTAPQCRALSAGMVTCAGASAGWTVSPPGTATSPIRYSPNRPCQLDSRQVPRPNTTAAAKWPASRSGVPAYAVVRPRASVSRNSVAPSSPSYGWKPCCITQ
jgi:hypothetical protein